jgi:ribosomal protein S27E
MSSPSVSVERKHVRHEPEKGLWHKVIRENLLTLIEEAKDPDDPESGIPAFVERELRDVLGCGLMSSGFLRLVCPDCRREKLVAFSCQARAACPSCGARRMADTATHLVERVLPDVALRQWVVTAPVELRVLLLADDAFMTDFIGIVTRTIFRHLRAKAAALDLRAVQCGAVTFIQRFSSNIGLFPHLHLVALDGVYTKSDPDSPPEFHTLAAPTERDEYLVSAAICMRIEALLRRRGLIDPDPSAEHTPTPLELHVRIEAGLVRTRARRRAVAATDLVAEDEQQEILMRHLLLPCEREAYGKRVEHARQLQAL